MLRPTVCKVTAESNYSLKMTFDNGETRVFDVKPYIKGSFYGKLEDESYFSKVSADGFTVCWPDGQDLCPDEIYYNSTAL